MYGVHDRRRFMRLKVNLDVSYTVESPLYVRNMVLGNRETEASAADLSRGGISLLTRYNIPVFSTLTIKFVLAKLDRDWCIRFREPVEVTGEVRYCERTPDNEYRLGICFNEALPEDHAAISHIVQELAVKSS
jgi:c-di-GMP-binding flagellar brake protein YcgR